MSVFRFHCLIFQFNGPSVTCLNSNEDLGELVAEDLHQLFHFSEQTATAMEFLNSKKVHSVFL